MGGGLQVQACSLQPLRLIRRMTWNPHLTSLQAAGCRLQAAGLNLQPPPSPNLEPGSLILIVIVIMSLRGCRLQVSSLQAATCSLQLAVKSDEDSNKDSHSHSNYESKRLQAAGLNLQPPPTPPNLDPCMFKFVFILIFF